MSEVNGVSGDSMETTLSQPPGGDAQGLLSGTDIESISERVMSSERSNQNELTPTSVSVRPGGEHTLMDIDPSPSVYEAAGSHSILQDDATKDSSNFATDEINSASAPQNAARYRLDPFQESTADSNSAFDDDAAAIWPSSYLPPLEPDFSMDSVTDSHNQQNFAHVASLNYSQFTMSQSPSNVTSIRSLASSSASTPSNLMTPRARAQTIKLRNPATRPTSSTPSAADLTPGKHSGIPLHSHAAFSPSQDSAPKLNDLEAKLAKLNAKILKLSAVQRKSQPSTPMPPPASSPVPVAYAAGAESPYPYYPYASSPVVNTPVASIANRKRKTPPSYDGPYMTNDAPTKKAKHSSKSAGSTPWKAQAVGDANAFVTPQRSATPTNRGRSSGRGGTHTPSFTAKQTHSPYPLSHSPVDVESLSGDNTYNGAPPILPTSSSRRLPRKTAVNSKTAHLDEHTQSALQQCLQIVVDLMNDDRAAPFNRPVDPVALLIPDYFRIITHPMDLRTIRNALEHGLYSSPAEVIADVRLVWRNANKFNDPASPVYQMATGLSKLFDTHLRQSELEPEPSHHTRSSGTGLSSSAVIPSAKRDELEERIRQLTKTLNNWEQQHQTLLNTPIAPVPPPVSIVASTLASINENPMTANTPENREVWSMAPAMSWNEKLVVARALSTVNNAPIAAILSEELPNIVTPSSHPPSTLELDIDTMSPLVLRRLESYLRQHVTGFAAQMDTAVTQPDPGSTSRPTTTRSPTAASGVSTTSSQNDGAVAPFHGEPSSSGTSKPEANPASSGGGANAAAGSESESESDSDSDSDSDSESSTEAKALVRTHHRQLAAKSSARATLSGGSASPRTPGSTVGYAETTDVDIDGDIDRTSSSAVTPTHTQIQDIVQDKLDFQKDVVLQNPQVWSILSADERAAASNGAGFVDGADGTLSSDIDAITNDGDETSAVGTPIRSFNADNVSIGDTNAAEDSLWSEYRNRGMQNKLREKERAEQEDRLRREKEEREREAKLEEERRRQQQEEMEQRLREEADAEKLRAEQALRQQREAERASRESTRGNIDMLAQSTIMRGFERSLGSAESLRNTAGMPPPAAAASRSDSDFVS